MRGPIALWIIGVTIGAVAVQAAEREAGNELRWPEATRQCRPWAYNWWLGSAVDEQNLARELKRYREGGLGGIHIIPIYGAKGAEARYVEYLSPRWMNLLNFTVQEAARNDLGVDMTTGTGWCFGGPGITPELGGRSRLVKRLAFPATGQLPAELDPRQVSLQALVAVGPQGQRQEITAQCDAAGRIAWKPPGEGWTLYALGHRFSRTAVKRAAPGGAGPMINPFDPRAMQTYLERFTTAFDVKDVARPRAMYHDSFEYFRADWAANLPAEFARRRGYRIEAELPALAGDGDAERVARVRCDVGETLSDLVVESVFPQWVEWCRRRGMLTRNQAHGAPANWLDFYALADIPETEMFGHGGPDPRVSQFDEHLAKADRDPLISKFASSAAHAAGKPLVSAETGTWLAEHFCETFEELKCEVDLLFLAGVNHVIYHGCVYSPDDAAWPGWLFYASTQMSPRNPLWREAPALNQYVTRCQSVFQSGQSDNDVLLYWPIHEAWSRGVGNMSVHNKAALQGSLGSAARLLWQHGYGFDYVSDRLLAQMAARGAQIEGPKGAAWQAIVIPECRQMPEGTLARLLDMAAQGATVIFERRLPDDVPGLGNLEQRRQRLRELLAPLAITSGDAGVRQVVMGRGRVLVGELEAALEHAGVAREKMVDHPGLRCIRRKHAEGRHYLIVNHATAPLERWVPLATAARSAVILDPLTGETGVASVRPSKGASEIFLRLEPGHSTIVRTFEQKDVEGPAWSWEVPGEAAEELAGPWQLEFIAGGPELPSARELKRLESWTAAGSAAEAFGGTASYRCTFAAPAKPLGSPLLLDLGQVRHIARVRLNGSDLGTRFMRPYRWAIPAASLKPQGNTLEVEVTNLAANRIRDLDRRKVAWRSFHDANVVNIQYRPFDASNWPVFESGLLGPVRMLSTKGQETR